MSLSDVDRKKQAFFDRFDPYWIKRMNEWAAPIADEINEANRQREIEKKKIYSKTDAFKKSQKKYMSTDKGRAAGQRRTAMYERRIREMTKTLEDKEKDAIRQFYVNCPKGYHVDHIIPIAKGGMHCISNLQYLIARENMSKGCKVLPELEKIKYEYKAYIKSSMNCEFCDNEMVFLSEVTIYCEQCRKAFKVEYEIAPVTHRAIDENRGKG